MIKTSEKEALNWVNNLTDTGRVLQISLETHQTIWTMKLPGTIILAAATEDFNSSLLIPLPGNATGMIILFLSKQTCKLSVFSGGVSTHNHVYYQSSSLQ